MTDLQISICGKSPDKNLIKVIRNEEFSQNGATPDPVYSKKQGDNSKC